MNRKIVDILKDLGWKPQNEKEQLLTWYYLGYWESLMDAGKAGEKLVRKRARTHSNVRQYLHKKEVKSKDIRTLKKWLNDQDIGHANNAFNELEKIETPEAKKILFETSLKWLRKTSDFSFNERAEEYLFSLSSPDVRQPLIEYLFRFPVKYGGGGKKVGQGVKHKNFHYDEDPLFDENSKRFKPLFMDYTPYILKLAGYKSQNLRNVSTGSCLCDLLIIIYT